MRRLAEIAAARPSEAIRYALRMLTGATNAWDHLGWRGEIRGILAATSHTIGREATENRNAIIDHYVTRGDHEFRDYVSRRQ